MAKIKHLIFDMGNVLMRYDPEVPLREYVSSEEARNLIRKELFQGPEWVERDRGTISIEEMYERVAKRIPEQYHEELKKCVYGWDICMEPLEESVKLCEDARKWGYQTYVLSNAAADEFYRYFPKFSPLEAFDGVMVSSEVHLIKPDVRIYECLLEKYQLNPEECLFFDDREDNVEGARKAGMQAMVFTEDYEKLRAYLKENAGIAGSEKAAENASHTEISEGTNVAESAKESEKSVAFTTAETSEKKKNLLHKVTKTMRAVLIPLIVTATVLTSACSLSPAPEPRTTQAETGGQAVAEQQDKSADSNTASQNSENISLDSIPAYSGQPYVTLNNNVPDFTDADMQTTSYEDYSELDRLGRCGVANAIVGIDLMPTEERGAIGQVKPSGWHTIKYEGIDGNYLYNRCHLIGYQLSGENANEKNLITGTRYLNVTGMLPFEDEVADYVKQNNAHVRYRVTPIFEENNLVASGVQMEAKSVEDNGAGVCYNVYVYNVQPGVIIDYATGDSRKATDEEMAAQSVSTASGQQSQATEKTYVLNTNTMKYHTPDCPSVADIKENNRQEFTGTAVELQQQGYEPCGRCHPE